MSAIFPSSKKGDVEAVRSLLDADPTLVSARDATEATPLHYAVWKGHPEVAQLLIERGADVNAHSINDHWGTTPLHAAAHSNNAQLVRLLIEHGADPKATDQSGKTPLDHTEFHRATAAAKVLRGLTSG